MVTILYFLTGIAFFAVIVTLVAGGASMTQKGDGARLKSNKWMVRRVIAQAAAIGLLALTMWVRSRTG